MQRLFEKNIRFFYENLPHFYELVKDIKQRNYLLKNDNLFSSDGTPVYPHSVSSDSERFAHIPTHNPLWEKDFFYIHPYYWQKDFNITADIINNIFKTAEKLETYTRDGFYFDKDFLPATVIYGLLAGKHLDILADRYEFHSLFVYEPNPEFFAISLYYVDYEKIYNKLKDRFFLWVKGHIDYYAIQKFFFERKITSTFFNLELTTYKHPLIEDAKLKFEEIKQTKLRGWGTFEDEYKGIKNHLQNINRYKTFKPSDKKIKIPVCIAANGKSLEKNIEFIKKNRNSMIIISVGTALKPLLKAGIQSDFHIEQERIENLDEILKDTLPEHRGYFIGASVVSPNVFKLAKKPLMYIREAFTLSPKEYVVKGSSPIVGNAGFALASCISDEIYLCGMDLGFRLNQSKHAGGSFYDPEKDTEQEGIKVKGNFSDDIYSNSLLISSRHNIELMIKKLRIKVYNLSDGAYINGSVPLKDRTLPKINKQKNIEKILENFKKTSFDVPQIDLNKILLPIINTLNFKIKSYKDLTGLVDFINDRLDESFLKYPNEYTLIRGSLYHILNNFYITSHKIKTKEIPELIKTVQKSLPLYQKKIDALLFNTSTVL